MGLGIASAIKGILSPLLGFADDVIHSGEEKEEQKLKFHRLLSDVTSELIEHTTSIVNAQRDVVVAEAKGHSWLQRNWRPIMAVWFGFLIGAHWFGFTAPNLTEEQILSLIALVKIMIGGYVGGRTIEKVAVPVMNVFKRSEDVQS